MGWGNTEEQFFNSVGRLYVQREGYIAPENAIQPKRVIPTFGEYSAKWFETFAVTKHGNTQNVYRSRLKVWQKAFGDKLVSAITPTDVQEVLVQRRDMKRGSLNNDLNILKQVLRMAEEDGLVTRNVADSIYVKVTGKDSDERRILTDEEITHCIGKLSEIEERDDKLFLAMRNETGNIINAEYAKLAANGKK